MVTARFRHDSRSHGVYRSFDRPHVENHIEPLIAVVMFADLLAGILQMHIGKFTGCEREPVLALSGYVKMASAR